MVLPKVNPLIRISGLLQALMIPLVGIAMAIVAWGIVSLRPTGNEPGSTTSPPVANPADDAADGDLPPSGSAAFLIFTGETDDLVVRDPIDEDDEGEVVTSFERHNGASPRGQASPDGTRVAVVHPALHAGARLTIVTVADGKEVMSPAVVDDNTTVAWERDGSGLVAVGSTGVDDSGRVSSSLLHINARTGETRTLATFEGVYRVAPVGYSSDGESLFVVVIDQSGSELWVLGEEQREVVTSLSSGRTRDWALNPDGTVLAYIEVRSGATVPTVGRAVFTATGAPLHVSDTTSPQQGVVWRPGSVHPGFGGPGGTLRLEDSISGGEMAAFLVPEAWSPDGTDLIARVVRATITSNEPLETWEVFRGAEPLSAPGGSTGPARAVLFDEQSEVSFLGWVTDTDAPTPE